MSMRRARRPCRGSTATRWWKGCGATATAGCCPSAVRPTCRGSCTRRPGPATWWCCWAPATSPPGPTPCRTSSPPWPQLERVRGMTWKDHLPEVRGRLLLDEPLGPFTWFRVGGPADVLFLPQDPDDLAGFLRGLDAQAPVTVL